MEQSKRRRKKNVYVEYDYEEAYQKQIENLEEDIIKRMMDGKKIKYVYATKEIKAGEQLEVEIYPEFTRKRVEEIPEEGRRKKDRQAQRNLNISTHTPARGVTKRRQENVPFRSQRHSREAAHILRARTSHRELR